MHQQDGRPFEQRAQPFDIGLLNAPIRPRHDHNGVVAVFGNVDERHTGMRLGITQDGVGCHAVFSQRRQQLLAEGIRPHAPHHCRARAHARRRDCLIGPLAPRCRFKTLSGQGLTWSRQTLNTGDKVYVDASENNHCRFHH